MQVGGVFVDAHSQPGWSDEELGEVGMELLKKNPLLKKFFD